MSLQKAIEVIEAELKDQGTARQPADGTVEWWLMQARALGLSWLRRAGQLELGDRIPAASEHYRKAGKYLKAIEDE
jgi:hypothetical protein